MFFREINFSVIGRYVDYLVEEQGVKNYLETRNKILAEFYIIIIGTIVEHCILLYMMQ